MEFIFVDLRFITVSFITTYYVLVFGQCGIYQDSDYVWSKAGSDESFESYSPFIRRQNVHLRINDIKRIRHLFIIVSKPSLKDPEDSRRSWYKRYAGPYPGFCRIPGTSKCISALCDCEKLNKKWELKQQRKQ